MSFKRFEMHFNDLTQVSYFEDVAVGIGKEISYYRTCCSHITMLQQN